MLAVPLVAGVVALLRDGRVRWLGVGYLSLLVFVTLTGGKPYYSLGLVPVLLAAGVPPVRHWLARGRGRRVVAWVLVAVHVVITAVLVLPVVPASALASTPVTDIYYDAGETVGWGAFTATVQRALAQVPPDHRAGLVVLTENYGEAGALDRARRQRAVLPPVYWGTTRTGCGGLHRAAGPSCSSVTARASGARSCSPAAACWRRSTTVWAWTTTSRGPPCASVTARWARGPPSGPACATSGDPLPDDQENRGDRSEDRDETRPG